MSEQIGQIQTAKGPITLTSFWGGDKRGKCLEITHPDNVAKLINCVHLTIPELIQLLPMLKAWVDDQVKPKGLDDSVHTHPDYRPS